MNPRSREDKDLPKVTPLVTELTLEGRSDSPHVSPDLTLFPLLDRISSNLQSTHPNLKLTIVDSELMMTVLSISSDGIQQSTKCSCSGWEWKIPGVKEGLTSPGFQKLKM